VTDGIQDALVGLMGDNQIEIRNAQLVGLACPL
jgi:hypothetical protein